MSDVAFRGTKKLFLWGCFLQRATIYIQVFKFYEGSIIRRKCLKSLIGWWGSSSSSNSYVEVLTSKTSERYCLWRQSLIEVIKAKMRFLGGFLIQETSVFIRRRNENQNKREDRAKALVFSKLYAPRELRLSYSPFSFIFLLISTVHKVIYPSTSISNLNFKIALYSDQVLRFL